MVAWLDSHTDYELSMPTRVGAPTLDRIRAWCRLLGDPERSCPVVHVTGTNGKGSTAKILTELLMADGLPSAPTRAPIWPGSTSAWPATASPSTTTSWPRCSGRWRRSSRCSRERTTRFELLTAAAFRWFADSPVDVAVVEVGPRGPLGRHQRRRARRGGRSPT